jgi:hypothetical protein
MGYQLLVWEGPRPEDDAAAGRECGVPVARVVPLAPAPSTEGSVTLLAADDEAYFSTGEVRDADS